MGKKKGGRVKGKKNDAGTVLGSDDEALYSDLEQPDEKSNDFVQDAVDIFHSNRDRVLLEDSDDVASSDQEEVLSLNGDDSDSDIDVEESDDELDPLSDVHSRKLQKDEMASDIEDEEDGLPDVKAWGKRKSTYYSTDFVDEDYEGIAGDAAELAELEEQEARALQKRLVEQLDDEDFGLDLFQLPKEETAEVSQKIAKDLSKLSKREKLKILSKEASELLELIEDFKSKMIELRDTIIPLAQLAESDKITSVPAIEYIHLKRQLILQYCTNITFYMILKAKRVSVANHPVIRRLVSFRNLLKQLEPVDKKLADEMNMLLEKLSRGEDIVPLTTTPQKAGTKPKLRVTQNIQEQTAVISKDNAEEVQTKAKEKKLKTKRKLTKDEETILDLYAASRKKVRFENSSDSGEDAENSEREEGLGNEEDDNDVDENQEGVEEAAEVDERRGITYQIAKNKGLTPKRKKEYRNPRVRHKMKYRKAKISRRGQVREARTELQKYGGEVSGIRAGVTRSIKMK
ncbi:something about silencing protein 10 [Ixodes scapularis]|uniref:something about silencing protein 10 n=1 Tax=Ixodes scapularis TaxID=6945 RepID=UPI001A9DB91B|nr:something about silencing protein 10 [Ixodes scapularis]XP_029850777.2 something about silencing protein 10 [Ixodes scapularis]XP_040360525.1 something about silencing protein 10 [Ixodes scapularis]